MGIKILASELTFCLGLTNNLVKYGHKSDNETKNIFILDNNIHKLIVYILCILDMCKILLSKFESL